MGLPNNRQAKNHLKSSASAFDATSMPRSFEPMCFSFMVPFPPHATLIITHIFWDIFMSRDDKPSCIEQAMHDLCFGSSLYKQLQKLVGNDKMPPRCVI